MPLFKFFESEPSGILFAPPFFEGTADSAHPGFIGTVPVGAAAFKTETSFFGQVPVPASRIDGVFPLNQVCIGSFAVGSAVMGGSFSMGAAFSGEFVFQPPLVSGIFPKHKFPIEFSGEVEISSRLFGSFFADKKVGSGEDLILKYSGSRHLI
jgi:hypothetical protein